MTACGECGSGSCLQPVAGIPIGACVTPAPAGLCAAGPTPCGVNEVCVTGTDPAQCHALCR